MLKRFNYSRSISTILLRFFSHKGPVCAVAALVVKENTKEFLLIRRGSEPNKGFWSLPGGKIEFGEPIIEALKRELKEEANVSVENNPILISTLDIVGKSQTEIPSYHYLVIEYLVEISQESAKSSKAGSDVDQIKWTTFNELHNLSPLTDNLKEIIEKSLSLLKNHV